MRVVVLMLILLLNGCQEKEASENAVEEKLYQTWVLVEKNRNGVKEVFPSDDIYPVTLTFDSAKNFHGRHDANVYEGTYELHQNAISFAYISITDVADIDWYVSYTLELIKMKEVWFTDANNMQLSSQADSTTLHFVSKDLFEKLYFEVEEWYN